MSFPAGSQMRVKLAGHPFHGKVVMVERDDPSFKFADGVEMRVVFVRHASLPEPIGMDVSHLKPA